MYKKVGFLIETEYLVYKYVTKKAWIISENIQSYKEKYMEQLVALDKDTSGENRMLHIEERR